MFTDIIWRFLILETFVMGALCDLCFQVHPQKQFCTNDFVLEVKFHGKKRLPVGDGYSMELRNILKGNIDELNIMDNRYVHFLAELPWDVILYSRGKYVIFGRNINGSIYPDNYEGLLPLKSMTSLLNLIPYYKAGCDCIDEIGIYSYAKLCQWLYSFLLKFGNNCKWVNSGDFKRCPWK